VGRLFSRVPFRSCIGDIDCVGVDVGNRGAQNSESSGPDDTKEKAEMNVFETMVARFMDKQTVANYRVLDEVKAMKSTSLEILGEDDDYEA
jgi:hypothetical protein